ncbi:MAG: hypothetical protein U0K36_05825 [Bacteroidales bacterium]|nr:hypothetical protein [Bacteroidales bacterium]
MTSAHNQRPPESRGEKEGKLTTCKPWNSEASKARDLPLPAKTTRHPRDRRVRTITAVRLAWPKPQSRTLTSTVDLRLKFMPQDSHKPRE